MPIAYVCPKTPNVWNALVNGAKAKRVAVETRTFDYTETGIIGGLQYGADEILRQAMNGGKYAFVDRACLDGGHHRGRYRVVPNAYLQNWVWTDVPSDRWERLRLKLRPWVRGGGHILVCPSSTPCEQFLGACGWRDRAIETLKKHTDRPIKVRDKWSDRPLERDLAGCHAVVCFASTVACEVILNGYPVFCDPVNAAAPVSETDFSLIESPRFPDREQWAFSLSYGQWSVNEMDQGKAWDFLAERITNAERFPRLYRI